MLLSNLSEKTFKTEAVGVKENSPFLLENMRPSHEAALELFSLLSMKIVDSNGSSHAATMLSAAAWMTGNSLYQSFHSRKNFLPDTVATSHELNREWETLVYLLEQYNFQKADIPVGRIVLAAMAAPAFFKPEMTMFQVQKEFQGEYREVMRKYNFDDLEGARVGIILCSILIQQYSRDGIIDPDAATGVAAQGIFEAARHRLRP